MYKISSYSIVLPICDNGQHYAYINGCSKRFEILSEHLGKLITQNKQIELLLAQSTDKEFEFLVQIGHILPSQYDEERLLKADLEEIRKKKGEYFNITVIPSYLCNFSCPYCFERDIAEYRPQSLKKKMTPFLINNIFSFAQHEIDSGKTLSGVTLFGGEPYLPHNKDALLTLKECCEKLSVSINSITNGYYIDEFIDIIVAPVFNSFKITIDGTRETHDRRRFPKDTGKSFDRIIDNIKLLLSLGKLVTVRTNINKENKDDIFEIANYFREQGFLENPFFNHYFKATIGCFEYLDNAVSDVEIMNVLGNTVSNYKFNSVYFRIYKQLLSFQNNDMVAAINPFFCGANLSNYVFDPERNVFSCWDLCANPNSIIGSINENGEVLFNENVIKWRNRTVQNLESCKDCQYKMFCGGGCSAQSILSDKNINEGFCDNFKEIFNHVVVEMSKHI